ncbi:MAG: cyclic nucleotide-binding domain-containing protein [Micavibrio sp.]|nr:cyclic nucleotide-binding domain-containing protein [Micavibrio sp.]
MKDIPKILERRLFCKGDTIFERGEEAYCAFLIQTGKVLVYSSNPQSGGDIEIARLDAGQIFGEMGLIMDGTRTASVRALENTTLIVITRDAFSQRLKKSDPMIKSVVEMMSQRMQISNKAILNKADTVDELISATRVIYTNIMSGLPEIEQQMFHNDVVPNMDLFLKSLRQFKDKIDK